MGVKTGEGDPQLHILALQFRIKAHEVESQIRRGTVKVDIATQTSKALIQRSTLEAEVSEIPVEKRRLEMFNPADFDMLSPQIFEEIVFGREDPETRKARIQKAQDLLETITL